MSFARLFELNFDAVHFAKNQTLQMFKTRTAAVENKQPAKTHRLAELAISGDLVAAKAFARGIKANPQMLSAPVILV